MDHAYAQNLANHLLCAFVANLKINAIYALYPESFCDENLAIRKVFAFCDSDHQVLIPDSSGQKLVLRNVGRRESGLYICRVGGNIINSIVINNIVNFIISMRLKNSLHINGVGDNIPVMMVRAARIVAALQPGCEEMERE